MPKKQKQSQKLHAAGEHHMSLQSPNLQYFDSFTEQWRELISLLGKRVILSDQKQRQINHLIVQWTFLKMQGKWLYQSGR